MSLGLDLWVLVHLNVSQNSIFNFRKMLMSAYILGVVFAILILLMLLNSIQVDGMDAFAVKHACKFAKEHALKNGPIVSFSLLLSDTPLSLGQLNIPTSNFLPSYLCLKVFCIIDYGCMKVCNHLIFYSFSTSDS